ncbi:MAG TPA: polysaccharide deacetylase family protein, partial [Campylobacter avium]
LYMSIDNLKSMHKQGMIIGSHSCNHLVFSKLKEKEQEKEIEDSFDFLESILKKLYIKTFCYPYGGFHTFTKFTEQTLQKQGVSFSFNVESRDVSLDDVKNRAQALPRYDCNEFCFGKANLG